MCEFYESSYPNSINISSNILCEENKLYIYNFKENHYDIIDDENDGIFRADLPYRDDYTYITVQALTKTIYGYIEGLCIEYEVVDRIDNSTLDNYAVNFTLNK